MNSVVDLMTLMQGKGVSFWEEAGLLHYAAPKGVLTAVELRSLRAHRQEILSFISGKHARTAPLAFSQLAHWNQFDLEHRSGLRDVALVGRLRGPLDVGVLRDSIQIAIERHDALRTQIVFDEGIPYQRVAPVGNCQVPVDDFSKFAAAEQWSEIDRYVHQYLHDPVNVASDSLFAARLLRLGTEEHLLILAMEHIVSDGASIRLLQEEILSAYAQIREGGTSALPDVVTQYSRYALEQQRALPNWLALHGEYWNNLLKNARRQRFPPSDERSLDLNTGWQVVRFRLAPDLVQPLRVWARLQRTTLVMTVFTVYVALVIRWCEASDVVIRFQTDGRVHADLARTIGYLASSPCLRIQADERDHFVDLLARVMQEYGNALEHADASYFEAQIPRPEATLNTRFNWIPQGQKSAGGAAMAPEYSPVELADPVLSNVEIDMEPFIVFVDGFERISGYLYYPAARFSASSMERFVRNFIAIARSLTTGSDRPLRAFSLVP